MKADIQHVFLQGLHNREVKRLMWVNSGTLEYENLPTLAKSYACALNDVEKVYNIEPSNVNRIVGLERKMDDISLGQRNLESTDTNRAGRSRRRRSEQ